MCYFAEVIYPQFLNTRILGRNAHTTAQGKEEREKINLEETDKFRILKERSFLEMQIKTTLRFHLTPVRVAIISSTTTNRCW
jgi:hypothetical protein